jgi:hypothetical protein
MNDHHPDGELIIPRSSNAHLSYKINIKEETVIIVKAHTDYEWRYQCELIMKYNINKEDDPDFIFGNDSQSKAFVKNILQIKKEINTVYITSNTGSYIKYEPYVTI